MVADGTTNQNKLMQAITVALFQIFHEMYGDGIEFSLIFYKKDTPTVINCTGSFSDDLIITALKAAEQIIVNAECEEYETVVAIVED